MSSSTGQQSGSKDQSAVTRPSLSATVAKLRKNKDNPQKVHDALVLIRKYFIKQKNGVDRLRHYGGVDALFDVIQGTNQKTTDVALSILGNICMDPKVQKQVLDIEGIKSLCTVIENVDSADVVNRACRTIANLAQNPLCCAALHDEENLTREIVSHLNKTTDENLQLTAIRALRLLADTPAHRVAVLNEEGLRAVSLYLKSEDERVIKSAYQTITVLSKKFDDVCARQIVAADAPAVVLEHTAHSDNDIRRTASSLLLNTWMGHQEMRVGIGNAGGVPFFIEHINTQQDRHKRLIMANALCLSCCEVVNRVRVKDNGGLQMMLKMLKEAEYARIHDRLISALACFLYDESGWEILMKNDLVNVIMKHLKRVANLDVLSKCRRADEGQVDIKDETGSKRSERIKCEPNASATVVKPESNDAQSSSSSQPRKKPLSKTVDATGSSAVRTPTVAEQSRNVKPITDVNKTAKESTEGDKSDTKNPDEEVGKNIESTKKIKFTIDPVDTSETKDTPEETKGEKDKSEEDKNKSSIPRYSVDSPTYKSVVDWTPDDYYSSGPTNILESEHFQCASPDRYSGYSSPSNYGPYSPLSMSSLDLSFDGSPRARSVSPNTGNFSPGKRSMSSPESSDHGSHKNRLAIWSPAHSSCSEAASPSEFSESLSPLHTLSTPSSPVLLASSSHDPFLDETIHFSSSEEDEDEPKDFADVSDADDDLGSFLIEPAALLSEPALEQNELLALGAAASGSDSERAQTEGPIRRGNRLRLNSDTSDTDGASEGRSGSKRTALVSKAGTKRKRDLTPEMRKRILLSVEKSKKITSPSIDLAKILSSSNVATTKTETVSKNEVPSDKRDHRRQTEYCLILLVKKISCDADPSEHLIRPHVLGTLMDYVCFASRPFSKCGRILVRLTKNTECFEAMVLEMVPQMISDRLNLTSHKESPAKKLEPKKVPTPKKTQHPDAIHRSMSACTLKETSKAVRFHKEVEKQKQDVKSTSTSDNSSDVEQLKNTLFSNLAFMAETPFGQGLVEHLLLTGTQRERMRTAVALSLICRSRSFQTKVYVDNRGLQYLILAVEQKDDPELQRHAVYGLFTMVSLRTNKLFPSPTKKGPPTQAPIQEVEADTARGEIKVDVYFIMEDGSRVGGCREVMAEQSEVFRAMLDGHYSESGQSEIKMPGVSQKAFQLVVDHLHEIPTDHSHDLDTVLEAHGLADRFILTGLLSHLADRFIAGEHLTMDTVQKIFAHAVLHQSDSVMRRCMTYVLVNPLVSDQERLKKFCELLSSPEGGVVVDVIENLFRN